MRIQIKEFSTFILTLISIAGTLLLGIIKGFDVSGVIPTILGIYIGGRSVVKSSAHWAASKDPNADTKAVVEATNDV